MIEQRHLSRGVYISGPGEDGGRNSQKTMFMGQRGLYTGGRENWGYLKITSVSNFYEESIKWQEMLFMNISSYTPELTSMWHLQSSRSNVLLGSVANCCLSLGPDILRCLVFVSKFLTVLFFAMCYKPS